MRLLLAVAAAAAVLLPCSLAQTRSVGVPLGTDSEDGNDNNSIPFWSSSATYQQLIDAAEMLRLNGGNALVLQGLGLRVDGSAAATAPARTLDVELTLGMTPVTAQSASASFATNLGSSPVVVLPFTTVNLPALTSSGAPNPPGWVLPFAAPFVWTPGVQSLVWQWRHRNASSSGWATLDAQWADRADDLGRFGQGCVATWQSAPAQITTSTYDLGTQTYRQVLDYGTASAAAVFLVGTQQLTTPVPGLCAPLELVPLATIAGATDPAGQWDLALPVPDFRGFPRFSIYGQFGFVDAGQAGLPFGVSQASGVRSPLQGSYSVARIWAGPFGGGGGYENATSGIPHPGYGLVTVLTYQ